MRSRRLGLRHRPDMIAAYDADMADTETSLLSYEYEGTTYWFCGKGCLLEFKDDPDKYLAEDYQPSM